MRLFLLLVAYTLPFYLFPEGKKITIDGAISSEEDFIRKINLRLAEQKNRLAYLSERASLLLTSQPDEEQCKILLEELRMTRQEITHLEKIWQETIVAESKQDDEGYALWDQEDITLGQLIMEYGSLDYLYIVPPEMGSIKLNIHSAIPIPRESWSDLLELLLHQNGIGLKKLNPYARLLYSFKQDLSMVELVASSREALYLVEPTARVCYLLSPPIEHLRNVAQFLERFSDPRQAAVHQVSNKLAIISSRDDLTRLLDLYENVWKDSQGKIVKVVPVMKLHVKEMEKILQGFFGEAVDKNARQSFIKADSDSITIFPVGTGNALALIGNQEVVDRGEKIILSTEEQLLDPSELTVFLYPCRHSDPTDLAKLLSKVYSSLILTSTDPTKEIELSLQNRNNGTPPDGYAQTPTLMINPKPIQAANTTDLEVQQGIDRFIPDPKTGTLLMVVRRDALSKIKDLLRQLDVPKRMVQIEVLLFEKKLNNQNNFGLNLLKIGGETQAEFHGQFAPRGRGVLELLSKRGSSRGFPKLDIAYSFLMTQEHLQLNAAPSVITVNQTPATISIQEEISINNGAAPIDTNKGIAFEKSFSRAQYGITIMLTPIIHAPDSENLHGGGDAAQSITLQTNITFDTTKPNPDDRPLVERRHIENEVRVLDGQTVILGGLRRKTTHDQQDRVPFLGELPFIGRLFGSTKLVDNTTEMFFFITPKIILDAQQQLENLKRETLTRRPGDLPEYLQRIVEAREKERDKFFQQSLKLFLLGNS
jgi:general secretion pathway protein D